MSAAFHIPPPTEQELSVNLSILERQLNDNMKCPAGRNKVYLRNLLTGRRPGRPRITLKCHLRKDIGMPQDIYLEEIQQLCCGDHEQCPAWSKLKDRFVVT